MMKPGLDAKVGACLGRYLGKQFRHPRLIHPVQGIAQGIVIKGLIVFNFGLWYTIKRQGSGFSPKLFVNAP
jgi:hypothetical protein